MLFLVQSPLPNVPNVPISSAYRSMDVTFQKNESRLSGKEKEKVVSLKNKHQSKYRPVVVY